jgi:hypothetical protein
MEQLKPKKISSLMTIGLRDMIKAERDPRFRISMGDWYHSNKYCTICFAGGVMAFSLGRGAHAGNLVPDDFDEDTEKKLLALDFARRGHFNSALDTMNGCEGVSFTANDYRKATLVSRDIIDYHRDSKEFKKQVRKAIRDLKTVGL